MSTSTHSSRCRSATASAASSTADMVRRLPVGVVVPAWHYHLIDIGVLAMGALAAKGEVFRPPYKSDELTEALGVELATDEERHTAMGDTRWVRHVYDAVMGAGA